MKRYTQVVGYPGQPADDVDNQIMPNDGRSVSICFYHQIVVLSGTALFVCVPGPKFKYCASLLYVANHLQIEISRLISPYCCFQQSQATLRFALQRATSLVCQTSKLLIRKLIKKR